jgi:protein TonB
VQTSNGAAAQEEYNTQKCITHELAKGTFAKRAGYYNEFPVNARLFPHAAMPRRFALTRSPQPLLNDYTSRILLSIAAVLSVAVMVAHVPGNETIDYTPWGRGEWSETKGSGMISSGDVLNLYPNALVVSSEASTEDVNQPDPGDDGHDNPQVEAIAVEISETPESNRRPIRSVATLGPDASRPRILGGMQRLYLNVKYPEEAQRQRIEGRVVVTFVVHETGAVSDIDVHRALHPLCDSSVVRAVRQTTFMPAEENGKRVAVRMELPVRFQLVDSPRPRDHQSGPTKDASMPGRTTARAASTVESGGALERKVP